MKMVKILLVEDESIEAMDIKQTLESFGYEVPYVTSSGEDAIEKAPAILPDLILIDIILNGKINGIQVANEIEKLNIPVIYLTAHTEESTVQKAKLTDPYGYIIKPYEQKDLKNAIDIAIYKHDLESKLKASENKYRSIVENVMDAYFRGDTEGRIIMASPSAAKMFRFASPEEMIGIPVFSLYKSPEDRQKVLEELKKHEKVENMEFEGLKKDDTTFWVSLNAQYHHDKQGKIQGTEAFVRDITELKLSQEALTKSEKNYRELVDNSLVGVYKTNFKGDILFANQAMADITHLKSVNDLKSKNIRQFYKNPADRNKIINKLKKEGIIKQYELDMVSATSETVNVLITAHLANNTELGMIINITERKKIEIKLQRSEEFLRNIVENIPNTIFIKSADKLIFKMVNKAAENLFEHSREELIGKTDFDFFPINEADFFTQKDREVLKNNKLLDIPEETILTKNSGQRILHTKKIPILNKEGNPQYLLGVSEDITERKKTEEQLKKSLNEKDVLLREIHHRVKNNMQIISSFLNLQSSQVFDKRDASLFTNVQDRVRSMALIHDNLYQSEDISSIQIKEYILALTSQLFATYSTLSKNIKLITDIMDITLNMETAIPLGLIISEMVTNSLKHAFPNSKGEISISLHTKDEETELIIKDNGVGVPKDFYTQKPGKLGLQLLNTLVEQLEGTIKLDRSQGTTFKITFKELKYKERI
jgi:PAS domain S-box-containing protein